MVEQTIAIIYVYALLREDQETPFYIGIGRGLRWLVHERQALRNGNTRKDRTIRKVIKNLGFLPKIKLLENLTPKEAAQIETALIQLIGRSPKGSLINQTDGGDGVKNLSKESKAVQELKNKLSWQNPEVRAKRIKTMSAGWTPEKRALHRLMCKQIKTQEVINRTRATQARNKQLNPPTPKPPKPKGRGQAFYLKNGWSQPEIRAKWIKQIKERMNTPEAIERTRNIMKRPEIIEKSRATNLLPEVSTRRRAAQRAAFSTPEAKARRSAASKAMWAKKRAQKAAPLGIMQRSKP